MFLNSDASEVIQQNILFTDSDFLGLIYHDKELLKETLALLVDKKLNLYPFTEFEFLRDVFTPEIRILREQFLASSYFAHIKEETHLRVFPELQTNALLLSKIYAQQSAGNKSRNSKCISFVDLFLASILMFLKDKAVLITGNKKDFPSCVFDIVAVLNFEAEDGCVRAISIVKFNQTKFDSCYECLQKLEKK